MEAVRTLAATRSLAVISQPGSDAATVLLRWSRLRAAPIGRGLVHRRTRLIARRVDFAAVACHHPHPSLSDRRRLPTVSESDRNEPVWGG
jgi:hypothetical protein